MSGLTERDWLYEIARALHEEVITQKFDGSNLRVTPIVPKEISQAQKDTFWAADGKDRNKYYRLAKVVMNKQNEAVQRAQDDMIEQLKKVMKGEGWLETKISIWLSKIQEFIKSGAKK